MKHLISLLLMLTVGITANAQSLKELLLAMPTEVCPLLSEYNRLELVDNQKNGKPMQTTNVLNTISEMKQLTDGYALLKTTKNTEKVFKLLHMTNGETIIAVVSTVYVDNQPDSHIDFYDLQWRNIGSEGRIGINQNEGFHYMELKDNADEMRLITGDPLCLTLNGSNEIAKPKATTAIMKWNGEMFVCE